MDYVRINAITELKAKILPAGKHDDGQGLWLIKRDQHFGEWILRYTIHERRQEMGLGPWPDVSIKEARDRAAEARYQLRDGVDPIADRARLRATTRRLTVKEAIEGCLEARQADLKPDGVAGHWMSPLMFHLLLKLGGYPVEDIDQHILKEALAPIWHKKPQAAVKHLIA